MAESINKQSMIKIMFHHKNDQVLPSKDHCTIEKLILEVPEEINIRST